MKSVYLSFCFLLLSGLVSAQTLFRFDFGEGTTTKGYQKITSASTYTKERGFGFIGNTSGIKSVNHAHKNSILADYCTTEGSFFFTVDIPEGNYDVKIWLGDAEGESETTVKVECRRLMLEKVKTTKGQIVEKTFTVHVRNPVIKDTLQVKLKPREKEYFHWDRQLTFEFCGKAPKVCALEITKNDKAVTVFLAGNSTVVDQAQEPYAAWGQMIPAFFKSASVAIANYAESGESLRSFSAARRLDKILSMMKKGDYLLIEFAHNDQKQKDLRPFVEYKNLLKSFIKSARDKGGIPVLVTSMLRRNFDSTGHINNTLGDFPEAMRQTAKEENIALIDLNAMSKVLWETLGVENSKKAFLHVPANTYPGQEKPIEDNTHFSNYGAYQLAKCIAEGLKQSKLPLANYLLPGLPRYNPTHPDSPDEWSFPQSPVMKVVKPDGN